jgi:hypothetical protein
VAAAGALLGAVTAPALLLLALLAPVDLGVAVVLALVAAAALAAGGARLAPRWARRRRARRLAATARRGRAAMAAYFARRARHARRAQRYARLHYCPRCDAVFLAGEPRAVAPAEAAAAFLADADPEPWGVRRALPPATRWAAMLLAAPPGDGPDRGQGGGAVGRPAGLDGAGQRHAGLDRVVDLLTRFPRESASQRGAHRSGR